MRASTHVAHCLCCSLLIFAGVLMAPLADAFEAGSEWIVAPGESPASLAQTLFPSQPAMQRRFVTALAALNPQLAIEASSTAVLETGSRLRMPDWRTFGSGPVTVTGAQVPRSSLPEKRREVREPESSAAPSVPASLSDRTSASSRMRLATTLGASPDVDERTRQVLRLEYRLLQTLNDQLNALTPDAARHGAAAAAAAETSLRNDVVPALATAPQTADSRPLAPTSELVAKPVRVAELSPVDVAPIPRYLKQVPHEPEARHDWWPYLAGGGVILLVALALQLRHKPSSAKETPLEHAETLVMAHPPSPPREAATGSDVLNVVDDISAVPPGRAVALPSEPDPADVNPVLELAEIMLSFGRVQGAAETLREYIESNPREALQPWIKLLEIYREGGMNDEFAALAARLNQNFNVEVQMWDGRPPPPRREGVVRVATLEALPHVRDRIVSLWGEPECSDYLRQLLRDNRDGERGGFTLPVVQEILLLIDLIAAKEAAA